MQRFIHISDTHIGPCHVDGSPFELHGVDTGARLSILVEEINRLIESGLAVDFVIHTGDLVSDGDLIGSAAERKTAGFESTKLAAEILSALKVPLYILAGNHDRVEALTREFGPLPGADRLSEAETEPQPSSFHRRTGWLDFGTLQLALLDARPVVVNPNPLNPVPFGRDMKQNEAYQADEALSADVKNPSGWLPKVQLDALEKSLSQSSDSVVICLHYPPLNVDCDWMDSVMLIKNGRRLHELLIQYKDRIACVLYGHLHHSLQSFRDGILYSSVASVACGHHAWPHLDSFTVNAQPQTCFNYISIESGGVIIKQYEIPV